MVRYNFFFLHTAAWLILIHAIICNIILTLKSFLIQGILKGFDQATNIILDESHERVYSTKVILICIRNCTCSSEYSRFPTKLYADKHFPRVYSLAWSELSCTYLNDVIVAPLYRLLYRGVKTSFMTWAIVDDILCTDWWLICRKVFNSLYLVCT